MNVIPLIPLVDDGDDHQAVCCIHCSITLTFKPFPFRSRHAFLPTQRLLLCIYLKTSPPLSPSNTRRTDPNRPLSLPQRLPPHQPQPIFTFLPPPTLTKQLTLTAASARRTVGHNLTKHKKVLHTARRRLGLPLRHRFAATNRPRWYQGGSGTRPMAQRCQVQPASDFNKK